MKYESRFTRKEAKNDFFYALVVVAMFVTSAFNVGAAVVSAGSTSVVAIAVRAWVTAASTYFASG